MTYVLDADGNIIKTDEVFKNGRYVCMQGKIVRISDGSKGPVHYARTDDLGTKGLLNHADGKLYDSRAAYENAVKAKGMVIVGDDALAMTAPKQKKVNWEKAVAQTLKSTPLKGKRK